MAKRFARVETTRLPLTDGDWIEIKRELTLGEILAARRKSTTPEGTQDDSLLLLAKFEAYLIDWSFRDGEGADAKPVAVSPAAIASLDESTAAEIMAAIMGHEKAEGEAGNAGGETAPTAA